MCKKCVSPGRRTGPVGACERSEQIIDMLTAMSQCIVETLSGGAAFSGTTTVEGLMIMLMIKLSPSDHMQASTAAATGAAVVNAAG